MNIPDALQATPPAPATHTRRQEHPTGREFEWDGTTGWLRTEPLEDRPKTWDAFIADALGPDMVDQVEVIEPVQVRGWDRPAYRLPGSRVPRRITGRALLCPFDPLVWERARTERIFGFRYRIEIYVPEPKREYGYYVFPFLLDGELVARVDVKADRAAGVLRVPGAFAEERADVPRVAAELAAELQVMAEWLGLDGVEVGERGDLAAPLARIARQSRSAASLSAVSASAGV